MSRQPTAEGASSSPTNGEGDSRPSCRVGFAVQSGPDSQCAGGFSGTIKGRCVFRIQPLQVPTATRFLGRCQ